MVTQLWAKYAPAYWQYAPAYWPHVFAMDQIATPEASKACNQLFVDIGQHDLSSIGDEWVLLECGCLNKMLMVRHSDRQL